MAFRTIQIFEHDEIKVGRTYGSIPFAKSDKESLSRFNERHKQRFFSLTHQGIKAKSYVGVVQVGNLIVEILPKIDRRADVSIDAEAKLPYRNLLLQMLRRTGLLSIELTANTSLQLKKFSLLDLYIETFLDEVSALVRRGLTKAYLKETRELGVIRGRILFDMQVRRNYARAERIWCFQQSYSNSHPVNLVLNEALYVLEAQGVSPLLLEKLRKVRLDFPELPRTKISPGRLERIILDRKTNHYERAFQIAKLILLNYSPDLSSGSSPVLAFLFDMNELWEKYVFRELHRNQARLGYSVKAQVGKRFWEQKLIRPDILLKKDGRNFIIDTKWKVLEELNPSDADLKQMFVYNQYFDSFHGLLLYPSSASRDSRGGKFHRDVVQAGKENAAHYCSLGLVSPCKVTSGKIAINTEMCQQILEILLSSTDANRD